MIHTIIEIYLVTNVFLTGTLWEEIKLQDYTFRSIIGFIGCFLVFLLFGIIIFLISDVKEFIEHKYKNKGIDVTNILYIIEKKLKSFLKLFKKIKNYVKRN